MRKIPLKHLIVIVPGILGSVLEKKGKVVWTASLKQFFTLLKNKNRLLLEGDSETEDDIGDGIVATRLIEDFYMVPNLGKMADGYTFLREWLKDRFMLKRGSVHQPEIPANYIEFPYDWRRTNSYSALRLKKLIDQQIKVRRDQWGIEDTKVILIGHSMGGLVSRYYLEVLGGWKNCSILFTLGTPHRGAIQALDYLSNGFKFPLLDMSNIAKSFSSLYELLPFYKCLKIDGKFEYVKNVPNINNVSSEKVIKGDAFHRQIIKAVDENRKSKEVFEKQGYRLIPVVGTDQRTYQTADFADSKISLSYDPPEGLPAYFSDGDGRVPMVSAVPLELSDEYRDSFTPALHASIQSDAYVFRQIYNGIKRTQVSLRSFEGTEAPVNMEGPTLSLAVEDVYKTGNPILINVGINNKASSIPEHLLVSLTLIDGKGTEKITVQAGDNNLGPLPAGAYKIELTSSYQGPRSPKLISDFFVVI